MSKKTMETLKEILCKELDKYAYNGNVSRSDLSDIFYLSGSIKNLAKTIMMDEQASSSASYRGGSYGSYMSGNGYSGDGGSSRTGYSSEPMSRRGGRYSYAGDDAEFISQRLETMMESQGMTSDEQNIMRRAMDILRRN